jgi:hypothetical protein
MVRKFAMFLVTIVTLGCPAWAAQKSWTVAVSDTICGITKHDAACVDKCVAAGAKYTLVIKGKVYSLEPQDKFTGLGGKNVKVTGTLKGDVITATSVDSR